MRGEATEPRSGRRRAPPRSGEPVRLALCWSASSTCPRDATWTGSARSPTACGAVARRRARRRRSSPVGVHARRAGRPRRGARGARPRRRGRGAVLDRRSRRRAPALRRARRRAVRRARRHQGRARAGRRRSTRVRRVVGATSSGCRCSSTTTPIPKHRDLPNARRRAFAARAPDFGPAAPASASGRDRGRRAPPLVACNCVLVSRDVTVARQHRAARCGNGRRAARRARAGLLPRRRRAGRRCR